MAHHVVIRSDRTAYLAPRAGAVLLFSGAALTLLGVLMPPAAEHSDAALVVFSAVAIAVGAAVWVRKPTSERILGLVMLFGTALITAVLYEAGNSGSTDDAQIVYLWGCLFSFYFFRIRHALAQLAVMGASYGFVLIEYAPADVVMPRWLTTMGTMLVAGLVVAILRNSLQESFEELGRQARRDPLTGALNRSALAERASVEFARARREGGPTSVLQIDVDHFKRLNDTLGHPAGDDILRRIAGALSSETRPSDAVARVGGDEFAVLLPKTSAAEATSIAERLCAAAEYDLNLAGIDAPLSVGAATADGPPTRSFDDLWAQADAAMYEAKRAGGHRVRMAHAVAAA